MPEGQWLSGGQSVVEFCLSTMADLGKKWLSSSSIKAARFICAEVPVDGLSASRTAA